MPQSVVFISLSFIRCSIDVRTPNRNMKQVSVAVHVVQVVSLQRKAIKRTNIYYVCAQPLFYVLYFNLFFIIWCRWVAIVFSVGSLNK